MKKRKRKKKLTLYDIVIYCIWLFLLRKSSTLIILFISMPIIIFFILRILKTIKKSKAKEKHLNSGIDIVDNLNGKEFEEFLESHFKVLEYKTELTPTTNDYGADLIIKKNGEKIVVQAKRYSSKVGIEAVQQIIGAKEYYKANKCMVITNNYFTPNAFKLAESSNVELWDRTKLLDVMEKINGKRTLVELFGEEIKNKHICKKCNSELIIKKGKYGEFYGCNNYPKCNYTEHI